MDIAILGAQETHTDKNNKEKRQKYTWYLNGNEKGDRDYAGVAIVIRNDLGKYVEDVIPHTPRIAEIRLKGVGSTN